MIDVSLWAQFWYHFQVVPWLIFECIAWMVFFMSRMVNRLGKPFFFKKEKSKFIFAHRVFICFHLFKMVVRCMLEPLVRPRCTYWLLLYSSRLYSHLPHDCFRNGFIFILWFACWAVGWIVQTGAPTNSLIYFFPASFQIWRENRIATMERMSREYYI